MTDYFEGERLQKVLSRLGIASRRQSEIYIVDSRIRINEKIAVLGDRVDVTKDKIYLDEILLDLNPNLVAYLLNKPPKVVSTVSDPQRRKKVVDFVPKSPKVYPVGRLDYDSEGLIILTNDGDLAYSVTHPSKKLVKTYVAEVDRSISIGHIRQLRSGISLDDKITLPAKVSTIGDRILEIKISEGRNRQIRRMLQQLGYDVVRLIRTQIGPIKDSGLKTGQFRKLEFEELNALRKSVSA